MSFKFHSLDAAVSPSPCPGGSWRAAGVAPSGFVRRHGLAALRRRSRARRAGSQGVRRSLSRQACRVGGPAGRRRDAGRSSQGLRVAAGFDRAHHGLCVAALRFRHQRSANREILRRRAGARDGARRRPFVLRARAQSPRRFQAERRDGGACARPLSPLARGHPQGEAASACRRPRTIVPGQIGQRRGRVEPLVRRHDGGAAGSTSKARA